MEILVILLPLAIFMGGAFVAAFIWSTKKGQYDDLETPRFRMLLEDKNINQRTSHSGKEK